MHKSLKVASEKTLNNCHIEMNTRVTALSVHFFVIQVASHVSIQFATIALTRLFVQTVFSAWNIKQGCSNDSSSSVGPVCVTAEVNVVEEEQSMWRRVKRGTKLQLDTTCCC